MAVLSNIEWKIESAVITALGLNDDLSGINIRHAHDTSTDVVYPCITVQCFGSEHPDEYAGVTGFEIAFVEINAYTERRVDTTGATCALNLGACRDSVRDVNFLPHLNRESGLTVYGAKEDGPSLVLDTQGQNRERRRAFTIRCWATCTDVPDPQSSSSSSSSSSEAQLLSSSSSSTDSSSSSSSSQSNSSSNSSSTSESSSCSSEVSFTSESSSSQSSSSTAALFTSTSESSANSSSSSPSSSQSSTSESSVD
jgi:hypothetical protein